MQIDTGSSLPQYQPARRTPFAACEDNSTRYNKKVLSVLHQVHEQALLYLFEKKMDPCGSVQILENLMLSPNLMHSH